MLALSSYQNKFYQTSIDEIMINEVNRGGGWSNWETEIGRRYHAKSMGEYEASAHIAFSVSQQLIIPFNYISN